MSPAAEAAAAIRRMPTLLSELLPHADIAAIVALLMLPHALMLHA